jgi:hypothetical protein
MIHKRHRRRAGGTAYTSGGFACTNVTENTAGPSIVSATREPSRPSSARSSDQTPRRARRRHRNSGGLRRGMVPAPFGTVGWAKGQRGRTARARGRLRLSDRRAGLALSRRDGSRGDRVLLSRGCSCLAGTEVCCVQSAGPAARRPHSRARRSSFGGHVTFPRRSVARVMTDGPKRSLRIGRWNAVEIHSAPVVRTHGASLSCL